MVFQEAFKKRSNFDSISALDFDPLGSIFGSQDASKIHPKSIKIWFPAHSCFCIVFYIDFASENGSPEPIRSSSRCSESTIFQKSAFQVDIDFWCDFPPNLAPLWRPKLKIFLNFWVSKMLSKLHRFSHRFFIDFGSVLASNMGPSWGPRRLQIRKLALKKLWR